MGSKRRAIAEILFDAVVTDYCNGVPFRDMMEKYGCGDWAIRDLVKRSGAVRRKRGQQPNEVAKDVKEAICYMYTEEKYSQQAIANILGVSQCAVSREINRRGLNTGVRSGEKHGSWKGGVVENLQGYVLQNVSIDSKYAEMRYDTGYVLKHRLVMAEYLGRCLTSKETVHHINGDKKDNRIENLQLMIGNHGKGSSFMCACCGSTDIIPIDIKKEDD